MIYVHPKFVNQEILDLPKVDNFNLEGNLQFDLNGIFLAGYYN